MPKGVQIFLNRKNYEDQIRLHGQYVIWKSSQACPCVVDTKGQPDPNCVICGGLGRSYYDETEFQITKEELYVENNVGTTEYGKIVSVDRVYDETLSINCFHGQQIIFDQLIDKSHPVYVDYTYSNKVSQVGIQGTYKGNGIVEFDSFGFQSTRGLFVSYEILSATNLENKTRTDPNLVFIDGFKNFLLLDEYETVAQIGDTIEADIEYIVPHLMSVVGITEKMRYANSYILPDAEAQVTVPNHIRIAEGDIFTMMLSEQAFSLVKKFHKIVDTLDHYDISRIIKVIDDDNVEYVDGTDYLQISRDKIKILNSKMLLGKFSVKYLYRIMFRAMQDLPSLRYGENQPFPRKIMLKQYSRAKAEPVPAI